MPLFKVTERIISESVLVVQAPDKESALRWAEGQGEVISHSGYADRTESEVEASRGMTETALTAPEGGYYPGVVYPDESCRILEWARFDDPNAALYRAKQITASGFVAMPIGTA